jgi:hypothetical protein
MGRAGEGRCEVGTLAVALALLSACFSFIQEQMCQGERSLLLLLPTCAGYFGYPF